MVERVVAAAGVLLEKQCQFFISDLTLLMRILSHYPIELHLRDSPGTTGNGLLAALAFPDANGLPLDGVLSAEGANVSSVLADFHLLHLLPEGGTVSARYQLPSHPSNWYQSVESRRKIGANHRFKPREERIQSNRTWYHIYR